MRRTKIIATLGPATDDLAVLTRLISVGVDAVRLNFSHGTAEDHRARVAHIRRIAAEQKRIVSIIADLQGPKIRIACFEKSAAVLKENDLFIFDAALGDNAGTVHSVGLSYKDLPKDVAPGDTLLVDDGRLSFKVLEVKGAQIHCQVINGGTISDHKGINRLGGGLSAESFTPKDKIDMRTALALDVDYIAISFPRSAEDIIAAKKHIADMKGHAGVIAKIERREALDHIEGIIEASDAIMVARGDLGVEIGDAALPAIQKQLISQARAKNKVVITATQMMESMIHSPIPTRAEVMDVANAVLDGTDAVMLSAETSNGDDPVRVVEAMSRICLGAEQHPRTLVSHHRLDKKFSHTDEAIAMATMYTANHLSPKAIICLTESGATALWMSRIRSGIAIVGLSPHTKSLRKMALYRGVVPIHFAMVHENIDQIHRYALQYLQQHNFLQTGDMVILTKGQHIGVLGGTNTMQILEVP
ncbi:MAG: pyk [Gammaproteobacteria bacterium]|jgi:pyruvate kinase|nr:pyk [Gammaproteobacteria bacterium]